MIVAFEDFELDPSRFELRRDGAPVVVEPQVFEVIAYLAQHSDRVVTKHELLDEVWKSRFVSESALTSRIKSARQALGDDGAAQRIIKTVYGRGYRFVAPVSTVLSTDRGPAAPAVAAPGPPDRNLPAERTPLFGRDRDIEAIAEALIDHRLVSVLGIGGTGKTRLAVAAARAIAQRFGDGVWFVDLVPVTDERDVELAIADAIRLALDGALPVREQLAALIGDRDALVVVDNAEHVAGAVARVLDDLLEATARPRFLVTSRVPLGLIDERRLPIDPLSVDDSSASSPAVELLASAARRFGVDVGDDELVLRRICRQLDGLPLALELAAAQLRHLDPADLADRLDRRFELLTRDVVQGPVRHSSLHDVLGDSVATLDAHERGLLTQMAAFPSSFTIDDLADVVGPARPGAVERSLGGLVDRSLVVRAPHLARSYRLLETVKLFGRELCSDEERSRIDDRHAAWCLERVGGDHLRHVFDFELADWCFDHHDNLRTATAHLTSAGRHREAALLSAGAALAMHSDLGSRAADVLTRIDRHLTVVDDDELTTSLHLAAVMCGMATRSPHRIRDHGERAIDASTRALDPVLRSVALVLGSWSTVFADAEQALTMTRRAAELAGEADDPSGRDFADAYRAFHLAIMRRYEEAEVLASGVVAREPRDRRRTYPTHVAIAALSSIRCIDDPAGALPWADEVLDTPSARNSMWANDLLAAAIHAAADRPRRAYEVSTRIRDRLRQAGQSPFPDLVLPAAAAAHRAGEPDLVRRWLGAVRSSGRPTQSFQATILYRRLREHYPGDSTALEPGETIDGVGADALDWLAETS